MFFRKKRYSDVEGYDRISRMIEDRQAEAGGGDTEENLIDDDTVLLGSEARDTQVRGLGGERAAPRDPGLEEDEEVEESVTLVRPPELIERPERPALRQRPSSTVTPTVTPITIPPVTISEPPPAAFTPPLSALEAPRLPVPELSPAAAQAGGASLVARDAVWEGKLVCSGNVRIEGTLRGEIETTGTLFVAAEARVEGSVRARNATLAGEVQGDVRCSERLEILPGGAARGEVDTGALVVHEGAFIESRFQMRPDQAVGSRQ